MQPRDTPRPEDDARLLEEVARRIVRVGMGVPAIFCLETARPLSYVGSQALVFFGPFVQAFLPTARYYRFAELMEDRRQLDALLAAIERELEAEDRGRPPRRRRWPWSRRVEETRKPGIQPGEGGGV